jgi:hypothetical protein
MPYLDCPRCHATFHIGAIYESLESCPRCGAPFRTPRPSLREQLRGVLNRRPSSETPDWEAITGSQYVSHTVTRTAPGDGSDSPTAD